MDRTDRQENINEEGMWELGHGAATVLPMVSDPVVTVVWCVISLPAPTLGPRPPPTAICSAVVGALPSPGRLWVDDLTPLVLSHLALSFSGCV